MKLPAEDYKQLKAGADPWTDATFPQTDTIRWGDYPGVIQDLKWVEEKVTWKRLSEVYPKNTLWGKTGAKPDDTQQGLLGDCYFISAAAAIAEEPERIKKNFLTAEKNAAGVYAVTLYPIGIPQTVLVDDVFPFDEKNQLVMGNIGEDSALWGPILEKAFAKVAGNYEMASGGWVEEGFRMLTGAPA